MHWCLDEHFHSDVFYIFSPFYVSALSRHFWIHSLFKLMFLRLRILTRQDKQTKVYCCEKSSHPQICLLTVLNHVTRSQVWQNLGSCLRAQGRVKKTKKSKRQTTIQSKLERNSCPCPPCPCPPYPCPPCPMVIYNFVGCGWILWVWWVCVGDG